MKKTIILLMALTAVHFSATTSFAIDLPVVEALRGVYTNLEKTTSLSEKISATVLKGSKKFHSRKIYKDGGCRATIIVNGKLITIYTNHAKNREALSIWVRNNSSEPKSFSLYDSGINGTIDLGFINKGEKFFDGFSEPKKNEYQWLHQELYAEILTELDSKLY